MIAASPADTPITTRHQNPGRMGLLLEVGFLLAVLVGTKLIFDQIVWRYAGPISLGITLAVLAMIMAWRGESRATLGLIRLKRWWSAPLILPQAILGVIAILAAGTGVAFAGDFLGFWSLEGDQEGIDARFGDIVGNLPVYLGWLALTWTSAAIGEEVFFRGYLINRIGRILPDARWGQVLSVMIPAFIFGMVHVYYQGIPGLIQTGLIGAALGTLYLVYKRNLWPLILAHGAVNTLSFTTLYLGLDI